MFRPQLTRLPLAIGLAGILAAQTQVDLRTQSKSVDFQGASMTRPIRTAASLPGTCSVNEVILLTTGAAGSNLYVCLTANNWVPQGGAGGAVTIQNSGTAVGARATQNFAPGSGIISAITDTGTKLNIQQTIDTSFIATKASVQAGGAVLCQSASASGSAYTCAMNPTLSQYVTGMVLNWRPDVNGTGGPTTLNIDILGAIPLAKADGNNPGSSDILAGQMYPVWYDGTIFRILGGATGGGTSSAPSTPAAITSVGAGGTTVVTGTSEWHAPLAACSGGATVLWNNPPSGVTAATGDGCTGTNANEGYAAFANTGNPSLQTSFVLPRTLTGRADVYVTYLSPTASGTFSVAMDASCTSADGSSTNDPIFVSSSFFSAGNVTAPATANQLGTITGTGILWPTGCVGGSRVHFRLIRTDTTGTAAKIDLSEVVVVMRRTL